MRNGTKSPPIVQKHMPNLSLADARRIVEHRIEIPAASSPGELTDDLKNLGGRGLLLKRFVRSASRKFA